MTGADSQSVGHIVAIAMWAGERIHDSERREAYYRHLAGVLTRFADSEVEQRAAIAARAKEPGRTPSGFSRAVREALAEGQESKP